MEDWAKSDKRPHRENRRQPLPARQHANHFDPGKIPLGPTAIRVASMHFIGHRGARVRCCTVKDLGIVVVQPFKTMMAIQRLDAGAHPAAEITVAISVNFDSIRLSLYQFFSLGHRLSSD